MFFKKQVDVVSKSKQNIGNITREEILKDLYETEKIVCTDWNDEETLLSRINNYKKIESKVNWLDENLNLDRVHWLLKEGITVNKSMFTERQYNCFIAALLNLKESKFAASFHEIYEFMENCKINNNDKFTDLELLVLSMWSYLFKKNFERFIEDNKIHWEGVNNEK